MEYYIKNFTKEQIQEILEIIKDCVSKNRYTVSLNENRKENIEFI